MNQIKELIKLFLTGLISGFVLCLSILFPVFYKYPSFHLVLDDYINKPADRFFISIRYWVFVPLVLWIAYYCFSIALSHYRNSTVTREQRLIDAIVFLPFVYGYISFYTYEWEDALVTLADGEKELYGNIVAGLLLLLLIWRVDSFFLLRDQFLDKLPFLFLLKATDRYLRLHVVVWLAAAVRVFGTIVHSFTVECLFFVVYLATSIVSCKLVKAFSYATLGLHDFALKVGRTTMVLDFLLFQDFVLLELFGCSRAKVSTLVICEMVLLAKLNTDWWAATVVDKDVAFAGDLSVCIPLPPTQDHTSE